MTQNTLLQSLASVFQGHQVVIIGAAALEIHGKHTGGTKDLDVAVSIGLEAALESLGKDTNWNQDGKLEHRWMYRESQMVDILPVNDATLEQGHLVLPASGTKLNVAGFRMAFSCAVPMEETPSVHVASVPAIAVLKMAAYMDRPQARVKDLADLAFVFWNYVTHEDDRLYVGEAAQNELWGEEASTYLLGVDIGRAVDHDERSLVRAFIQSVSDSDVHVTRFVRATTFRTWSEPEVKRHLELIGRALDHDSASHGSVPTEGSPSA